MAFGKFAQGHAAASRITGVGVEQTDQRLGVASVLVIGQSSRDAVGSHRPQGNCAAATKRSAQALACAASRASTMTRNKGSVPLARIKIRPVVPNSASTASVAAFKAALACQL
jgi:hypothetical protein